MPESVVYECSGHVLNCKIDDEIVLLDLDDGIYHGLDGVASRIWEILSESARTFESLCTALEAEYDMSDANWRAETRLFLEALVTKKLVCAKF